MRHWLNWIEHRSSEPRVTGSNPVWRTINIKHNYINEYNQFALCNII